KNSESVVDFSVKKGCRCRAGGTVWVGLADAGTDPNADPDPRFDTSDESEDGSERLREVGGSYQSDDDDDDSTEQWHLIKGGGVKTCVKGIPGKLESLKSDPDGLPGLRNPPVTTVPAPTLADFFVEDIITILIWPVVVLCTFKFLTLDLEDLREELSRIDESWAAARFDSLPHVVHILTSKDREAEVQFLKEQSD
ncbi:hypothetical protein G4B88_029549, partial [Cannabis sativa]